MRWRPTMHLLLLLLTACGSTDGTVGDAGVDAAPDADLVLRCNGRAQLCDRSYEAVAYATAHNAMSNGEAGWSLPNQNFGITRQLNDGVRGLMLDTYEEEGQLLLCHSLCGLGSQPLVDGLGEIKAFLDTHPQEVVSIIFESYISHAQYASAFDAADLTPLAYAHDAGELWPTLQELIDAGTPLVVFQDVALDDAYPWLMNIWDHAWETHYSWQTPEDFNCNPNRGNPANTLFILNHFLTQTVGMASFAQMVNFNPLFIERAEQCQQEGGQLPNFVTVDFYDIGDVFEVVDTLNGL